MTYKEYIEIIREGIDELKAKILRDIDESCGSETVLQQRYSELRHIDEGMEQFALRVEADVDELDLSRMADKAVEHWKETHRIKHCEECDQYHAKFESCYEHAVTMMESREER